MGAERLREAAALMRSRAEAASKGPWKRYGMAGVAGVDWEIVDERRVECECGEPVALTGCATNADALHIASWHPAVAQVVADQLDGMAAVIEEAADGPLAMVAKGLAEKSLAVADVYLGSDHA